MSSEVRVTSATDLAELKQLFGKPPVLSTESEKAYDEIVARLMQCFKPKDFMEQLLIRQLADCTWEMIRYRRHKTLTIEHKFRQFREYQARQIEMIQADRKQELARAAAGKAGKPATEQVEDIDEILNRPAEELDHARAFESGIEHHEKLDVSLDRSVFHRNDAFRQLEQYREGFGRRLRQVSDEIIDAEFKDAEPRPRQVEAPLVRPAKGAR